jgi:lysozyme
MKLSPDGKKLIQHYEGCALEAYLDGKYWSIGYGHNGPDVEPGMKITKVKAGQLFLKDVEWAEEAVTKAVKVPLVQNEFDALVSFVFNVGEPQFLTSTLLKRLNLGERAAAADHFLKWVYANKAKDPGLIKRRGAERKLFMGHGIETAIQAGEDEHAIYRLWLQSSGN